MLDWTTKKYLMCTIHLSKSLSLHVPFPFLLTSSKMPPFIFDFPNNTSFDVRNAVLSLQTLPLSQTPLLSSLSSQLLFSNNILGIWLCRELVHLVDPRLMLLSSSCWYIEHDDAQRPRIAGQDRPVPLLAPVSKPCTLTFLLLITVSWVRISTDCRMKLFVLDHSGICPRQDSHTRVSDHD